jgi:predicted metal-dependent peptidase
MYQQEYRKDHLLIYASTLQTQVMTPRQIQANIIYFVRYRMRRAEEENDLIISILAFAMLRHKVLHTVYSHTIKHIEDGPARRATTDDGTDRIVKKYVVHGKKA